MSDNYKKEIDRLIKIAGVKAVNRISDPIRVEDAYQPKKRKTLKEMIRVTADTPEEAQAFMALLKNAGIEQSGDMPHDHGEPHDDEIHGEPHDETPCGMEATEEDEIKQGADYRNSPDEEYESDPQNTYSTKPTRRKDIRVNSIGLADDLMREWTDVRDTEEIEEEISVDEELSAKQKKLPDALRKAIAKKQGGGDDDESEVDDDESEVDEGQVGDEELNRIKELSGVSTE